MNADEIKTYAIKATIAAMTWLAARYLPPSDQASLAAFAPTIAAGLVAFGAFAYGAWRSTNMKLVPEKATAVVLPGVQPVKGESINLTPMTGLAKVVGALLIGFLALQAMPAHAQTKTTAAPASIAALNTSVLQALQADAQAALADATSNNDTIAAACYKAIADVTQAKLSTAQLSGGAALAGFQKLRDVTRLNSSPTGTELIVGCAPLVQDAKLNFVQFFTNLGGLILLKGIIPIP